MKKKISRAGWEGKRRYLCTYVILSGKWFLEIEQGFVATHAESSFSRVGVQETHGIIARVEPIEIVRLPVRQSITAELFVVDLVVRLHLGPQKKGG